MTLAGETLAWLARAGIAVRAADGKLFLWPRDKVTDEHRRMATQLRDDIVRELEARRNEELCDRILARLPPAGYGRVAWLVD